MLLAKSPVEASGATPLYIAAQEGQLEVVKPLLDKGAAVPYAHSKTALQVAEERAQATRKSPRC
jgi:ankyrin repeat protein